MQASRRRPSCFLQTGRVSSRDRLETAILDILSAESSRVVFGELVFDGIVPFNFCYQSGISSDVPHDYVRPSSSKCRSHRTGQKVDNENRTSRIDNRGRLISSSREFIVRFLTVAISDSLRMKSLQVKPDIARILHFAHDRDKIDDRNAWWQSIFGEAFDEAIVWDVDAMFVLVSK